MLAWPSPSSSLPCPRFSLVVCVYSKLGQVFLSPSELACVLTPDPLFLSPWMILSCICWGGHTQPMMLCRHWQRPGTSSLGVCLWTWCWGCQHSRWGRGSGSCRNCCTTVMTTCPSTSCPSSGALHSSLGCSKESFLPLPLSSLLRCTKKDGQFFGRLASASMRSPTLPGM